MTEETLEKLAQLLEQDQFELLIPEKMRTESEEYRIRHQHGYSIGISDE